MITNSKIDYTVKKHEEINNKNTGESKPDQGVKKPIATESRKEELKQRKHQNW